MIRCGGNENFYRLFCVVFSDDISMKEAPSRSSSIIEDDGPSVNDLLQVMTIQMLANVCLNICVIIILRCFTER